ncbi:MAG: ATP synthase subunit I [Vicinamibacterales bacterium]
MTSDTLDPIVGSVLAVSAGAVAGAAHFAGLWATVRALPESRHPAGIVLVSFLARGAADAAVVVALVRAGGWRWAALGLAGFLAARTVAVHLARRVEAAEERP